MRKNELTPEVIAERKALANHAKEHIKKLMRFDAEDEQSLMTTYRDFYLQISFSELHPLMVICAARKIGPLKDTQICCLNELNLRGVIGCHMINTDFCFYHFRLTQWLDTEMTPNRFLELLDRCIEEAEKGYSVLKEQSG